MEKIHPIQLFDTEKGLSDEKEIPKTVLIKESTSLDWLGRFRNPALQQEFIVDSFQQRSAFGPFAITLILSLWAVTETIASLNLHPNEPSEFIFAIICFISTALGLVIFLCLIFSPQFCCRCSVRAKSDMLSLLQLVYILTMNWIFLSKIIQPLVISYGPCLPRDLDSAFRPPPDDASHPHPPSPCGGGGGGGDDHRPPPPGSPHLLGTHPPPPPPPPPLGTWNDTGYDRHIHDYFDLPSCAAKGTFNALASNEMILVMVFCPLLLMAVMYEPRLYVILFCYLITAILLLYSVYSSIWDIFPLLCVLIVVGILLVELHFQRIHSFLNRRKLQMLLKEQELNADAMHAMELRHMIGNVAHDLKTPLASFTNGIDLIDNIISFTRSKSASMTKNPQSSDKTENGTTTTTATLLQPYLESQTAIIDCVQNIRNTTAFMLMTINRCIDYTKASKGMKLIPKFETIALPEVLQFPIDCMRNMQDRIGISLAAIPAEICPQVITDKQWLQENLLCLLSNAVKYSLEGTVEVRVSPVSQRPESLHSSSVTPPSPVINQTGYLQFEIEDTGIGISEEMMTSLFNPFKQAQRLAGGTGLGLFSLAKRTEALKGSYGVRPRGDGRQGSLFWFAIPYRPDPLSIEESSPLAAPLIKRTSCNTSNSSVTSKPPSLPISRATSQLPLSLSLDVLVVEDTLSVAKILSMMLKRLGHQVTCAEHGEIALRKIEERYQREQRGFDLILMDLQMPVMDGLEATRRLRQLEKEGRRDWSRLLIIGASANSDEETVQEGFLAGLDDFIAKPFSMEALNKLILKHHLIK